PAPWRRWTGRLAAGTTCSPSCSRRSARASPSARSAIPCDVCSVSTSRRSSSRRVGGGLRPLCVVLVLVLASSVVGWASGVEAGVADQVGATFGLMVQEMVAAFPAVEGIVVAVDDERIYLDLTEK